MNAGHDGATQAAPPAPEGERPRRFSVHIDLPHRNVEARRRGQVPENIWNNDFTFKTGRAIVGVALLAAAAIVATAGGIMIRWDKCTNLLPGGTTTVCKAFVEKPQFLVWLLLISAQVAFSVVILWPVFQIDRRAARSLRGDGVRPYAVTVSAAILLGAVAVVFAFASSILPVDLVHREGLPSSWPLPSYGPKVGVAVGLALIVGLLAVAGVWLTGMLFDRICRNPAQEPDEACVYQFMHLRGQLNGLLGIAGIIVGIGTLGSGALRNAVLALNQPSPAKPLYQFDEQYVLVYGLFFTGLLALAYLPSFLSMRAAGTRIREASNPLPPPGDPAFGNVVTARKTLDDLLQISVAASASFKAGVAIFAPLGSALVGLLLPKIG